MPGTVYLVRHGHAASIGEWLAGWTPGIHLDDLGREQARTAAEQLRHVRLKCVYTSPLERCYETAQVIADVNNVPVRVDHRFGEFDFGEWTGLTFDELRKDPRFEFFNRIRSQAGAPGGETAVQAQHRIVSGIEEIARRHAGQPVAIVSHADMIRYALAHYRGVALDDVLQIDVEPGAVIGVQIEAVKAIDHRDGYHARRAT